MQCSYQEHDLISHENILEISKDYFKNAKNVILKSIEKTNISILFLVDIKK